MSTALSLCILYRMMLTPVEWPQGTTGRVEEQDSVQEAQGGGRTRDVSSVVGLPHIRLTPQCSDLQVPVIDDSGEAEDSAASRLAAQYLSSPVNSVNGYPVLALDHSYAIDSSL